MAAASNPPASNEYNEESDEDYDPNAAPPRSVESSSDDEGDSAAARPRKPKASKPAPTENDEDADLDFDNSGDELTIQSGRKRKRKSNLGNLDDDDDGGEGGFIKTRAQRKADATGKKPLASVSTSSLDVDALWANMSAAPPAQEASGATVASPDLQEHAGPQEPAHAEGPTVTIKRKYDFAGKTVEEERKVSASSAEAKLFLAEQQRSDGNPPLAKHASNRPRKRKTPFASLGSASNPPFTGPVKAQKLNTLEKSKLDWAAHVDKEGIADELDEASRAKGSYLSQVDFLGRMDAKQEDLRRQK